MMTRMKAAMAILACVGAASSGRPAGGFWCSLRGGGGGSITREDVERALQMSVVASRPKQRQGGEKDGEKNGGTCAVEAGTLERGREIAPAEVARALQSCKQADTLAKDVLLDPTETDLAVQARIEAAIKTTNIQHNLEQALEHSPELYSSISMIRVNCQVNGLPVEELVCTHWRARTNTHTHTLSLFLTHSLSLSLSLSLSTHTHTRAHTHIHTQT